MSKDKKTSAPKTELMTKLKLTISERLAVQLIFPKEGTMLQQRVKRRVYDKFELTDKELEILNPQNNPGGGVQWTEEAAKKVGDKTVKLNDIEFKELEKQAKALDKDGKVPDPAFNLCDKILGVKESGKTEEENKDEKPDE